MYDRCFNDAKVDNDYITDEQRYYTQLSDYLMGVNVFVIYHIGHSEQRFQDKKCDKQFLYTS